MVVPYIIGKDTSFANFPKHSAYQTAFGQHRWCVQESDGDKHLSKIHYHIQRCTEASALPANGGEGVLVKYKVKSQVRLLKTFQQLFVAQIQKQVSAIRLR